MRRGWRPAAVLVLVAATPAAVHALGVDWGTADPAGIRGPLVHTLFEWSAVCVAGFTALLAFTHFAARRDLTAPIIGIALLSSGLVDAFHVLAADGLLTAAAPNERFVPFTWAISRVFNVLALVSGVIVLLRLPRSTDPGGSKVVHVTAGAAAVAAAATVTATAVVEGLPSTMFPDDWIRRPWDAGPLVAYILLGLGLMPALYRRHRSRFVVGLWLSVIPHVATQIHMCFGSERLFDHDFHAAHALKVVAYLVPFASLWLEYADAHRRERRALEAVLDRNAVLADLAYTMVHSMREPIRATDAFISVASAPDASAEDRVEALGRARAATERFATMLEALVNMVRIESRPMRWTDVDLSGAATRVGERLRQEGQGGAIEVRVQPALRVRGDADLLDRLFDALLRNARDFARPDGVTTVETGTSSTCATTGSGSTWRTPRPCSRRLRRRTRTPRPLGRGWGWPSPRGSSRAMGGGYGRRVRRDEVRRSTSRWEG